MTDQSKSGGATNWKELGVLHCQRCNLKTDDASLFQAHNCKPLAYIGNKAFIIYKSETNKFLCSLCSIDLLEEKFEEHLENHVSLKPYICKYCKFSCDYETKFIHSCHSTFQDAFELNISMQTKKVILTARQNHDKKEYFRPIDKSFISNLKSVTASESCTKAIHSKSTPSENTATTSLPSIRTSDKVLSSTVTVNSNIDLLKGPHLKNPVVHNKSMNPFIHLPMNLAKHQPSNPLIHMPILPVPVFHQQVNATNHQPMTFPQNYCVHVAPSFNTTNTYSYVNPIVSPSTHTLKQSLLMNDPGTGLSKSPDYFLWHKPSVMASANSADVHQQKCIYSHLNIEESFEVDKSKFERNTDVQKAASISFPENFEGRIIAQKPNNFNDTLEKDNYSYLLFIKGLFLCLKCKMKWSANYTLFFMHIWQQHSHDDDNFACCPDGFSLKCEKLKKVLISVYRKSPESMPDVLKRHLLNQQHDSIASETVSLSHSSINKTQKMSSNEMNSPTSGQTSCQNVTEEITRMNIISNEDKTRIVENLLNETTVSMKKESPQMNNYGCHIPDVNNSNMPSLSDDTTSKRSEAINRNNRYSVDNMEKLDIKNGVSTEFKAYYQCGFQDCTYASIQPVDLLSHTEEIHGAETNFPCIYCGYLGATSSTLLDHLGEHIGSENSKVFSGSLLENSSSVFDFESKDIYSIIGRFEEELKSYTITANLGFICNTCKTKFYTLKELRDHLIKSLLKVVSCKHCRSCFLDVMSWQRHRAKEHPNEPRLYCINRKLLCDSIQKNNFQFKSAMSRFKRLYSLDKQNQFATNMEDDAESKLHLQVGHNTEIIHPAPSHNSDSLNQTNDTAIQPCDLIEVPEAPTPLQLENDETNNNVVSEIENTSFLPEVLKIYNPLENVETNINVSTTENTSLQPEVLKIDNPLENVETNINVSTTENTSLQPEVLKIDNSVDSSKAQKIDMEQIKSISKDINPRETNDSSTKAVTSHIIAGRSSESILDDIVDENSKGSDLRVTYLSERPPESNITFMRLLSEICGEKHTDLLLKPLYDCLEENCFSCKQCKLKVSTLKRLHGHLFHCIGKMGLVHCPHCGYQGEHSKYVVHHIQKQHPGENCKLLIYLNVNISGLMQTLQTNMVNVDTFADLCAKFKSGGGGVSEQQREQISVMKNTESANNAKKCSSLQKKSSKKRRSSTGEEESTSQKKKRSAFSNVKHGKFNSDTSLEPNVHRSGLKPGAKRTALNRYQCRLGCTFICKWNESLMVNHLKTSHPYCTCGYCGAVYFIKEQLENHFKYVHRGLEPFKVHNIKVADFFKLVNSQIVNENEINMDKRPETSKLNNSEDKIGTSSNENNSKAINDTVHKESVDKSMLKQKLKDRLAKQCGLIKKTESTSLKDLPFKCTVCRSSRKSVSDIIDHFKWLHADKDIMFLDRTFGNIYSSSGEIVSIKLGTGSPSLDHLCYFCTYRHHVKSVVEAHIKTKHSDDEIKVFSLRLPESHKTDECGSIDSEKNLTSSSVY